MVKKDVTLGQEILRLRKDKGISQFDLAVRMNWNSTSPIIQIEKNRRIPKIETLEKLSMCMNLDYLETYYLLGLAGYVPPTKLPQMKQITSTLGYIAEYLANIQYPAYVIDYRFRFWLFNPASSILTFGDYKKIKDLLFNRKGVFDIIFDSRLGFRQHINDIDKFDKDQIFKFKASNSFRQHEDFLQAYPECMNYLLPEDYDCFTKAWSDTSINKLTEIEHKESIYELFRRSEEGDLIIDFNSIPVYFNVAVKPILHLGDLFQIISYTPVNSGDNKKNADLLCERYGTQDLKALVLWECASNNYLKKLVGS